MAHRRARTIAPMMTIVPESLSTPSVWKSETETNAPIMNTSPWAKLISSMMP
jgi:hypothetical protein